jgi:hypothetical protein
MNEQPHPTTTKRPTGISVIAIINGIACVITILFWAMVFFRHLVPWPGELTAVPERANAATTYGFLIGDILWSAPLLYLAAIGVWRLRPWGWTSAQMVNALWVYSMTVIWIRDAYTVVSPGALLFTPFTLVAIWSTYYLWNKRGLFWAS